MENFWAAPQLNYNNAKQKNAPLDLFKRSVFSYLNNIFDFCCLVYLVLSFKQNGVRDAGDILPLLCRGWAHQCACCNE